MRTLAKIVYPDESPHNVAFHQGQRCLLRQKQSSEREIQFYLKTSLATP